MKAYVYALIILGTILIFGCQNFFTYSPLDILQRDPDTLSKEQKLLYARQALSSGNKDAMEEALDVVVNDLIPDDPTNADLWLLCGDLLWTLSDVPDAILDYLNANDQTFPDQSSVAEVDTFVHYIEGRLEPDEILLFQASASVYYSVDTTPSILNPIQQLAAGLGLLSVQLALPLALQDLNVISDARDYITEALNKIAI
jgi:tetratricopeptide (TPR) repeat protein